jgi:predicted alpha/beta hydrolase
MDSQQGPAPMSRPTSSLPTPEPVSLRTRDGLVLAGTHFVPAVDPVRGAVVVAAATGVARRFYAPFCSYLAQQGFAVLSFDYRGIGDSAPARLKGFEASMAQWGSEDLTAALAWMAARHAGVPQYVVGHSVGGQVLGLVPPGQLESLSGVLLVASQGGYWGMWRGVGRVAMLFTWYALIPGMTALVGYLPMRRFGQGEDLPAGVAQQWARWGRHPGYFLADEEVRRAEGYARLRCPLRTYALTDDAYAPLQGVQWLASRYPNAGAEVRSVTPAQVGQRKLGHFGFFRERVRDTLWAEAAAWLAAPSSPTSSPGS